MSEDHGGAGAGGGRGGDHGGSAAATTSTGPALEEDLVSATSSAAAVSAVHRRQDEEPSDQDQTMLRKRRGGGGAGGEAGGQAGAGVADASKSPESKSEEQARRTKELLSALESDLLACDAQFSLFYAATESYRHDSILRPFPPDFLSGGDDDSDDDRDIESLRECLRALPDLAFVRDRLRRGEYVPLRVVRLLHWILVGNPPGLRLKTAPREEHRSLLSLGAPTSTKDSIEPSHVPTYIFRVETAKTSKYFDAVEELAPPPGGLYNDEGVADGERNVDTLHGFHGSATENFHSILSRGLLQHLNKNSLFGQGIYLSTEVGMALGYSKGCAGWPKSRLQGAGGRISAVALCQIVDHADVKMNSEDPARNRIAGSEGGAVPERYLIVRNNDLVRPTHILVYVDGASAGSAASDATAEETAAADVEAWRPQSRVARFLADNKTALLLLGYGLLLVGIGLFNSPAVWRFLRKRGLAWGEL